MNPNANRNYLTLIELRGEPEQRWKDKPRALVGLLIYYAAHNLTHSSLGGNVLILSEFRCCCIYQRDLLRISIACRVYVRQAMALRKAQQGFPLRQVANASHCGASREFAANASQNRRCKG